MNPGKNLIRIITSIGFGLFYTGASAFTLNSELGPLAIDFRAATWQAADGQSHFSEGSVTAFAYDDISIPVTLPTPGTLSWENDGLGVSGGSQNDEIDGSQGLAVIANDHSLTAVGVWLNDFFATTGSIAETGRLSFFNLGSNTPFKVIDFTSDVPNLPGSDDYAFYLDFGGPVSFGAALFTTPNGDRSEYAVAGFDTAAPVPVPPAIWLLGSALIFLLRKQR